MMWAINFGTLVAYAAFTIDILLQIRHIVKRKSSKDLSIKGCLIRLVAGLMFLIKMISTKDAILIIGQGVFSAVYTVYVLLLIRYRR